MTSPGAASWWSRECGGREVLDIALPMVASTMSWTLMSFIDSALLVRVSTAAMSAAFTSGLTWFAVLSFFWGLCSYGSTFVSQFYGDDQPEKIGPAAWQGVFLAAIVTPLILAARPLAPWLFALHPPEMAALEVEFFRVLCWAAPGMLAAQSLETFFSGQGKTRVVMCVDAAAVVVNLIMACILVLGWGGFGSWGIAGAAWSTVIAQWFRAGLYASLVLSKANREQCNTWKGLRWDGDLMRRLVRYGGPSGLQVMLDVAGFTYFVQMVGKLGLMEAESTSLAFRVNHVAFMPVLGIGIATTVLVGQKLGEDRAQLATRAAWTSLAMALGYMVVISLLFTLTPRLFLQAFVAGHGAGEAQALSQVLETTAVLMRFVAAYNVFDAIVIVFVSTLKGAGDTRFVMRVSFCSATLLVLLTWLGVDRFRVGLYGCWAILTGFIWSLAVVYAARFLQGRWREMRVIEQIHHAGPGHGTPAPAVELT